MIVVDTHANYNVITIPALLTGKEYSRLRLSDGEELFWDGASFSALAPPNPPAQATTDLRIIDDSIKPEETYIYKILDGVDLIAESELITTLSTTTSNGYGHYFGNYKQPADSFGEILTTDDIVKHYLWGLPQVSSGGDIFHPEQIAKTVKHAASLLEASLHINITAKNYTTEQTGYTSPEGTVFHFDKTYPFYSYRAMRLQLTRRPVFAVHTLKALNPFGTPYFDLINWHVVHSPYSGLLTIQPQGNMRSSTGANPSFGLFPQLQSGQLGYEVKQDYANGYLIRWTAGWPNASAVPDALRHAVGILSSIFLLDIQGDGLLAGLSSTSISMDGISRSYSSTQSPTNAYYGARIGNYTKQLENLLPQLRAEYAPLYIGTI